MEHDSTNSSPPIRPLSIYKYTNILSPSKLVAANTSNMRVDLVPNGGWA